MAHANRVLRSINLPGELICVDIFQRPDGSYGFDEFRRDPEDARGWYSIGHHGHRQFASEADTVTAAQAVVLWLKDMIDG